MAPGSGVAGNAASIFGLRMPSSAQAFRECAKRIKAPADVGGVAVAKWRRSPAQPVTLLIGSTNPSLRPAKP
ncbi:hypothetical protein CG278_25265 [Salmonella enterica subsp. enterica serovar Muenchen]|nr:hypothetical protein [Salmonella enterica subsp. enterica serovar Muenchen]